MIRPTIVLLAASLAACGPLYKGMRPMTPDEEGAPVAARYTCTSARYLSVVNGKIVEKIPEPSIEVRRGPQGPFVVSQPPWMFTNHWRDADGEHYFWLLRAGVLGSEIVFPPKGPAVQLMYGSAMNDHIRTVDEPDGTLRPAQLPEDVSTCLPSDTLPINDLVRAQLSHDGPLYMGDALLLSDAIAVPTDQIESPSRMFKLWGCSAGGTFAQSLEKTTLLEDNRRSWMPGFVYVSARGTLYVSAPGLPPNDAVAFALTSKPDGLSGIGALQLARNPRRTKPENIGLVGKISGKADGAIACEYVPTGE